MLEMNITAVKWGWLTLDQVPSHLQEKVAEALGLEFPIEEESEEE